jgi:hypothetical protein
VKDLLMLGIAALLVLLTVALMRLSARLEG